MKNLNITKGCDYKVTHKETKQVHLFNAQELANFVFKNDYTASGVNFTDKYDVKTLNRRSLFDKTPEYVLWLFLFILITASILMHIQLNY